MRAIVVEKLGSPNDLLISDRSTELPRAGEVVIDVMTAAVNFADLLVIEGKYQFRPPLPFIPGKEASGVVVALGDGVDGLAIGDRVMVQMEHGAFAERIVTSRKNCFLIPDKMSFEEAAAIGIAYQTAYLALVERAKIQAGETVLVTAASGSVGIAAIQLAKAMKCTVIAGLETMSKAPFVDRNGADHIVDLSGNDLRNSIRNQVKNCLVGDVDVIIEMIGGKVFDGAVRTLGWCGRLVVVGFAGGAIPIFKTNYALLKNITVTGVDRFSYLTHNSATLQRAQAEIFRLFVEGRIHLTIQKKYSMEQVVDAFDVIRDRKVRGKVVLSMNNEM